MPKFWFCIRSSDHDGFPVPEGCYYSQPFREDGVVVRELFIVFQPKAGLKHGKACKSSSTMADTQCMYKIVFNALLGDFGNQDELVELTTFCLDCPAAAEQLNQPYFVLTTNLILEKCFLCLARYERHKLYMNLAKLKFWIKIGWKYRHGLCQNV